MEGGESRVFWEGPHECIGAAGDEKTAARHFLQLSFYHPEHYEVFTTVTQLFQMLLTFGWIFQRR